MCKVHNPVGCLTTIKTHLRQHGINDFHSLNEVLHFQRNFASLKQQIISNQEQFIKKEQQALAAEILQSANTISTTKAYYESYFLDEIEQLKQKITSYAPASGLSFIQRFTNSIKRRSYRKKLQKSEINLNDKVNRAIRELVDLHQEKTSRYHYITTHFSEAVQQGCAAQLNDLEHNQRIIDEVKNSIYGALGEHKVVKELENLPDENVLINDFSLRFSPALYYRQENDYIKSIQIDHLLVTPSGIFLIETKNWSEKSLASLDLRSPVQQVRRTNFALYKTLTKDIARGRLNLQEHHWGDRKIPIRNLIVLINAKPGEEFQHVKVLTLNELLSYVKYFKPIFSIEETQIIANYLLYLN